MNKVISHIKTVSRHKHEVFKNCVRAGIPVQGILHDLSKFSPTEFISNCHYYQGNRSPNEAEREEKGYSAAWLHHKGRNRHHYEYWLDYSPVSHRIEGAKMPLKYVIEMFCDRVAACKTYMKENYNDSSPLAYYQKGVAGRTAQKTIHPKTAALLEKLLVMLSEKGEDYTFAYIRHILRKYGNKK